MRSVLMMAADSLLKGLNKVYSLLNRETQVQGWFDFDHRIPTEKQQRTLKITCFSPIQHTGPFASKPIGSQKVFFTFRFKFLPLVCLSSTSPGYHSAIYVLFYLRQLTNSLLTQIDPKSASADELREAFCRSRSTETKKKNST